MRVDPMGAFVRSPAQRDALLCESVVLLAFERAAGPREMMAV